MFSLGVLFRSFSSFLFVNREKPAIIVGFWSYKYGVHADFNYPFLLLLFYIGSESTRRFS